MVAELSCVQQRQHPGEREKGGQSAEGEKESR